jgi:SAM-dependent methyltransferase
MTTTYPAEPGGDLATAAAFFELGDRLGILHFLETSTDVRPDVVAREIDLPEENVRNYLEAMRHAGFAETNEAGGYRVADTYPQFRYEAGYVSWSVNANRPFLEHAREFMLDPEAAYRTYERDLRQVAVASEWIGATAFYPKALEAILSLRPQKFVDLGAGSGRLLIDVLSQVPGSTGVALDISQGACDQAELQAKDANLADRLTVTCRTIQSVADDPAILDGADVVHGGFVFHDMMPEEEDVADRLLAECRKALSRTGGTMAITDVIPYIPEQRERAFSACTTYFHQEFMKRKLLSIEGWKEKFRAAGFTGVEVVQHRMPSARLFLAKA